MKKYAFFLLFISLNIHTKKNGDFFPSLPSFDLFILIAKHFQNYHLPTVELQNIINQASEEARTTPDWIGIISNKARSHPSKGHTPATYLAAYTRHPRRQT